MRSAQVPSKLTMGVALSPREVEIISLLGIGMSSKEVGRRLSISYHTVIHHLRLAMTRLGVRNRAELIRVATLHGFLALPSPPSDPST